MPGGPTWGEHTHSWATGMRGARLSPFAVSDARDAWPFPLTLAWPLHGKRPDSALDRPMRNSDTMLWYLSYNRKEGCPCLLPQWRVVRRRACR